jgi:hypothetical protein
MPSISLIIGCLVSIIIIYYLKNLETIGCKCALNFKHDYIFIFTCVALLIGILNILFSGFRMFKIIMLFISIPYFIAAIVNVVFTIQYVDEMQKINCECSESVYRTMMYILAIINAFVWGLSVLIFIYLFYIINTSSNNKLLKSLFQNLTKKI